MLTVVDFDLPSTEKRLWVLDLANTRNRVSHPGGPRPQLGRERGRPASPTPTRAT
ncbi:MAG: hypothetical protein WKG07_05165 [Hymenobacter sp.]